MKQHKWEVNGETKVVTVFDEFRSEAHGVTERQVHQELIHLSSTLTTTQSENKALVDEIVMLREALKGSLDFIDQVVDKSPAEFYDPVHPMLEGVRFVLETGRAVLGGVE